MVRATSVHFPKDILRFGDLSYWSLSQVETCSRARFQKRRNAGLLALARRLPSAPRRGKAWGNSAQLHSCALRLHRRLVLGHLVHALWSVP